MIGVDEVTPIRRVDRIVYDDEQANMADLLIASLNQGRGDMKDLVFGANGRAAIVDDSAESSSGRIVASISMETRCGEDLTRADLEKLRDWINGRLEETKPKPQPWEIWSVGIDETSDTTLMIYEPTGDPRFPWVTWFAEEPDRYQEEDVHLIERVGEISMHKEEGNG